MTVHRHLSNAAWLTLSGAIAKALLFAASVITYKRLSVPANGLLGFGLAYGSIAALFMEGGVRGYMIRELSRIRENAADSNRLYSVVLNARGAMVLVVAPVGLLVAWLLGYHGAALLFVAAMMGYGLLDSMATLQKAVLRCYDRMNYDALFSTFGKAILVALLLLAAHLHQFTLAVVGGAYLVSALLEVAALAIVSRSGLTLQWGGFCSKAEISDLLRKSWPFASIIMVAILYLRTAVFALSAQPWLVWLFDHSRLLGHTRAQLSPESSIAQFTTAARLPETLSFLPVAVMNAMIPFLSRNKANTGKVQSVFTVLVQNLGLAGFLLAPWLASQAGAFLLIISKADYLLATHAFTWLALAVPFSFLHYTTANLLMCLDEERTVLHREFTALTLNVILNIVLVPYYSFTGAAAALMICEIVSLMFDLRILSRHSIRLPWKLWAEWLFTGAIVGALSSIGHNWPPLVAILPGAAAVVVCGSAALLLGQGAAIKRVLTTARSTAMEL